MYICTKLLCKQSANDLHSCVRSGTIINPSVQTMDINETSQVWQAVCTVHTSILMCTHLRADVYALHIDV